MLTFSNPVSLFAVLLATLVSSAVLPGVSQSEPASLLINEPPIIIQFAYPGGTENWPSIVHWLTMLESFIESQGANPSAVTSNFISYSEPGIGYDPGAYIALEQADDPPQRFTGQMLVAVLEKFKEIQRPLRANFTILPAMDQTRVIGSGCMSGANDPCELEEDAAVASARKARA